MNKLYSTSEASVYLGLSVSTVKHHVHTVGDLKGQLVGKTLVFSQDELEKFKLIKRPAGRPRKEKV